MAHLTAQPGGSAPARDVRAVPPATRRSGLPGTLRSEFTKIRSVRSTYVTLAGFFLAALASAIVAAAASRPSAGQAGFDPTSTSLQGTLFVGELIMVVIGALVITTEYGTRMMVTSLAAMPRRGVLYAAKAIALACVTLLVALTSSFTSFLAGQAVLASTHAGASSTSPGALRAVLLAALVMTCIALLAFGLGAIVRHTAGAIGGMFAIIFVIPVLGTALPKSADVVRWLPGNDALYAVVATKTQGSAYLFGPYGELSVFAGYAAIAVVAGALLFRRRDALRASMPRYPLIPVIPRDDGDGITADDSPPAGQYAGCVEPVHSWLRSHPLVAGAPLAAGVLALSAAGDGRGRSSGAGYYGVLIAISVLLVGLVLFRRKHPAAALAIAVPAAVADTWVLGPKGAGGAIAAMLVLLYTLAAYRPRRISLRGPFSCLVGLSAAVAWSPERVNLPSAFALLLYGVPMVSVWIFGDSVANRRAHNAWLEDRARRAEAERDARAQLAVAAERSRIAREMHDIIAHNLAVIVGLADGGRYAAARSPERSSQALGAIASTGREALSELRRLLGVLTGDDDRAADLAPQPGLTDLEALLDRVRAAGLPVRAVMRGDPGGLSEGQQLTVYRIVQEALTNTLKHAGPAATAEVILGYADGAVDVQVTDTGLGAAAGPSDGGGRGLPGMRERAAVYDGTLRAGPGARGGWRVEAHLPAATAVAS